MPRYNLVLGGQAGQGINTVESVLVKAFKASGYHTYATKEYMSRVRGGINTITLSVGSQPIRSYSERIDILLPFTAGVVDWVGDRLNSNSIVLGNTEVLSAQMITKSVFPLLWQSDEVKQTHAKQINTLCAGLVAALFGLEFTLLGSLIRQEFSDKAEKIIAANLEALEHGTQQGLKLKKLHQWQFPLVANSIVMDHHILNGSEAVALGALSAGCNALSFYPMSPSTGVANFLIQHAETFGLAVEQFEDELAAVSASVGCWYAGGCGLVTTSGGGFALMEEMVSLAGMSETPLVIHLAQRPGPATGLPTRSAQGDLNLVLYAGHGDFPRTIFAPSTIEQGIALSARAFTMAERFQTPAFILTDQYFVDTYYCSASVSLPQAVEPTITETTADYRRYALTLSGLSPRGIPNWGQGIVLANGNEHDEYGDTTEALDLSKQMPEKRMAKYIQMVDEALEPELVGAADYSILVIGWGSTFANIRQAVEELNDPRLALLHFSQLYPLPKSVSASLAQAQTIITIEQNFSGQFADLLQRDYCCTIDHRILKYDGRVFSTEQINQRLTELLKGLSS